ncbi:MAG: transposase [Candidatus Sungbacteria bacterium]|uniref:Transposase n=1 Tax=Candidatus Sungiibacteriota bacterium TaxID=2750080 RepID=A0A932DS55_9BACT|nr:transposase [Candidatus Sungbacteria bacterium]
MADLKIFRQVRDYDRFLSLLFCSNGEETIPRLDFKNNYLSLAWDIRDGKTDIGKPLVGIVAFSLVPTHIHLLLKEIKEKGISDYLHKILTSHAKYFNLKYDRRGHVFESKFNSRYIDNNRYLLYLSQYIHKNHSKLSNWSWKSELYPWSSYRDFVGKNRWGKLLDIEPIVSQFRSVNGYRKYVAASYAEENKYEVSF